MLDKLRALAETNDAWLALSCAGAALILWLVIIAVVYLVRMVGHGCEGVDDGEDSDDDGDDDGADTDNEGW